MGTKVSVIIPTYNRPESLRRAIQSVSRQTFTDYDIFVVHNGGLINGTKEIVESFQHKGLPIQYIYEKEGNGAYARNIGILRSNSDLVAFLDDDDLWFEDKLQHQVTYLETNPDVALVACKMKRVTSDGTFVDIHPKWNHSISFHHLLENGCIIPTMSSVLVRRACFKAVGYFNPELAIANDYEFYVRLAQNHTMVILAEPLLQYGIHGTNISRNYVWVCKEMMKILNDFKKLFKGHQSQNAIRKNFAWWAYTCANELLNEGGRASSRYFLEAVTADALIGTKFRKVGRSRNVVYAILRPYFGVVYGLWRYAFNHSAVTTPAYVSEKKEAAEGAESKI